MPAREGGLSFPISRDPPEGGTIQLKSRTVDHKRKFPISRDPPEGGTIGVVVDRVVTFQFPISRDPPEGEHA